MRRLSAHMASADRAARTTAIDSFQDAIERAKEGLRASDLAVDFSMRPSRILKHSKAPASACVWSTVRVDRWF
jgi:hypothetical protein